MGVSSSESHDLTAFYEMLSASFGVLSQNTGFYPSLDRIIETTLGPLNLGPGGGSYNEPISRLQQMESEMIRDGWGHVDEADEAYHDKPPAPSQPSACASQCHSRQTPQTLEDTRAGVTELLVARAV